MSENKVITAETIVGDVLDAFPATLPIFLEAGFTPLGNEMLRRTVARRISIAQACALKGVDVERFLARLREVSG